MDVENGNWKVYLSPKEIETCVDIAASDFLNLPHSPYGVSSFLIFPTHSRCKYCKVYTQGCVQLDLSSKVKLTGNRAGRPPVDKNTLEKGRDVIK